MDKIPPTNPPISPNANYFGSFNGRNSQNNQNSKDSSKDSEENKEKFDTMQDAFKFFVKQSEEHNNDSKNTITNSNATAQILIPTNSYGIGNGGNNQLDRQAQEQSATIEKDGRGDTTAYNGGFTQLLGEKDERTKDKNSESRAMGEGSQGLGEGSQGIGRINKQKARLTDYELNGLNGLETTAEKHKRILNAYKKSCKQNLINEIRNNFNLINDNPTQIIKTIGEIDKLLTQLNKAYPESQNIIDETKEKLKPLKEKYLPQKTKENTHKDKSKSNDDFGIGM